jgi:osmotically-inducible protein OsmY
MARRRTAWLLAGIVAGASAAFFLDSRSGKRRRIRMRDKCLSLVRDGLSEARRVQHFYTKRLIGLASKVMHKNYSKEPVDDDTLNSRVRSELGHCTQRTKAVKTFVKDGVLTLYGDVNTDEIDDLVRIATEVQGVKSVVNQLVAH